MCTTVVNKNLNNSKCLQGHVAPMSRASVRSHAISRKKILLMQCKRTT